MRAFSFFFLVWSSNFRTWWVIPRCGICDKIIKKVIGVWEKVLLEKEIKTSLPTCSLLLFWLCLCDEELKRKKKKKKSELHKEGHGWYLKTVSSAWRSMLSCLSLSGSTFFPCFGQWSCLSHPAIAHSVAINIYILPLMIAFGRLLGLGALFELHTGESKILSIKCWHLSRSSLLCYDEGEKRSQREATGGPVRPSECCPRRPSSPVWMLSLHRGSTVLPEQKCCCSVA